MRELSKVDSERCEQHWQWTRNRHEIPNSPPPLNALQVTRWATCVESRLQIFQGQHSFVDAFHSLTHSHENLTLIIYFQILAKPNVISSNASLSLSLFLSDFYMNAFDTSNSPTTEDDLVLFSSNVTNSIWKHPLNISTFLSIDFHLFFFSIQPEYGISLGFLGNDEMVINIWLMLVFPPGGSIGRYECIARVLIGVGRRCLEEQTISVLHLTHSLRRECIK